jgi:hypothetical protein
VTTPGEQLRRLPVPVRPVGRETIGSFMTRLARANSLRIPHLLALAAISGTRDFTPATDDTRGWSQPTPERIAALAGRPLPALAAAIPLLATMTPATSPPLRACGRCTAAKNINGMVIIRARPGDYLCTRHQQWLRGPRRPGLAALPEVTAAQRRHDKHAQDLPDAGTARAYQLASDVTAQWLEFRWHLALTDCWHERNRRLTATIPGPEMLHADVITHPEMLAVARLLITVQHGPGTMPGSIADRLGFPYPSSPTRSNPSMPALHG